MASIPTMSARSADLELEAEPAVPTATESRVSDTGAFEVRCASAHGTRHTVGAGCLFEQMGPAAKGLATRTSHTAISLDETVRLWRNYVAPSCWSHP